LALAAYAAGNASDHPIAKLILTEENTAKAARPGNAHCRQRRVSGLEKDKTAPPAKETVKSRW
jgi:hypothetical protein